jgi:DNA-binding Lrp family transcriptional regulator
MEFDNKNDKKILAHLKKNGPSRLWELTANVGMPSSTRYQRLLRLEARRAVLVGVNPSAEVREA